MGKKYFHELSDEDYDAVFKEGMTWGELMNRYKPPTWCSYPDALEGRVGCWSLLGFYGTGKRIRCERDCINCDCYEPKD